MKTCYNNLYITSLTPEQKSRTCGYWYTVTNQSTAHTAFQTRDEALSWLRSLNLTVSEKLSQEGTHQSQKIIGSYTRACVMTNEDGWDALPGIPTIALENGSYRPAKLYDDGEQRVLYTCNANNRWAKIYDYQMCRKMQSQGVSIF